MNKKIKLEKDTKDLLSEQEKIKRLTEHEGWPIVRSLFLREAAKLLNMSEVNVITPLGGNLVAEIGMRQLASAKILSILNDILGTAEQFDMNSTLTQEVEQGYILRVPERRR